MAKHRHNIIEALGKSRIFAGCSDEKLADVAARCELREYEPGETAMGPEDFPKKLRLVVSGQLRVSRREEGKIVHINTLRDGDCFGAVSLFDDSAAEKTEVVLEVAAQAKTAVACLSQKQMEELIHGDPVIRMNYISFLTGRIRFLNSKIRVFTGGSVSGRLAGEILGMHGRGQARVTAFSDLARRLDVGRASLYRAMEELEGGGYISRSGKLITILDEAGLRSIAN